jgi:hypothetical protein
MPRPFLRALALAAGIFLTAGGCANDAAIPASSDLNSQYTKLVLTTPDLSARASRSGSEAEAVSKEIGPEGGTLETANGHKIVFPAGALSQPTKISMREDRVFAGVELEPHGLRFPVGKEPVLTLSTANSNPSLFSRLVVVYTSESGIILEVLPTLTLRGDGAVTTRLRHFSGYIIAGS